MRRLKAFGHFWYDFIVGDDWRIAVAVAIAFGATAGLSQTAVDGWWVTVLSIAIVLPVSVWSAARRR